jgi:hypothetical protein
MMCELAHIVFISKLCRIENISNTLAKAKLIVLKQNSTLSRREIIDGDAISIHFSPRKEL